MYSKKKIFFVKPKRYLLFQLKIIIYNFLNYLYVFSIYYLKISNILCTLWSLNCAFIDVSMAYTKIALIITTLPCPSTLTLIQLSFCIRNNATNHNKTPSHTPHLFFPLLPTVSNHPLYQCSSSAPLPHALPPPSSMPSTSSPLLPPCCHGCRRRCSSTGWAGTDGPGEKPRIWEVGRVLAREGVDTSHTTI